MTNFIEILKQYSAAFEAKNIEKLGDLLHEDYTFKGPLMSFDSKEQMLGFAQECPFECTMENVSYITDENKVVQIFDWVMKQPMQLSIHMCEYVTIKDRKIYSAELFYDSAKFPAEFLEQMPKPQAA